MASTDGFQANPTVLHASPPTFPPPLSSQPPNAATIQRAILNPPFVWKGVPLRSFRCTSDGDLSILAGPEEKGQFLGPSHEKRYKSLKKHLYQDLEDLARRHKVENKLESAIRVAAEEREVTDFHEDFTQRLEWGEESSSLILGHNLFSDSMREEGILENGATVLIQNSEARPREDPYVRVARFSENGQGSPFPSVRNYFRHYPAISISLTVTDFYRRLEQKREEFGNALEFQQMWEWSERHWNFFEAVSHLRDWARSEKGNEEGKSETLEVATNLTLNSPDGAEDLTVIEWSPELEARKRRHQWAILRRIIAAFEINEEDFPEICAPGGRTLDSYFALGKYGGEEKWYPVDQELEGKGKGGIKEAMEQIDCFEDVLASGGGLAEASMAIIKRNRERDSQVTCNDASATSDKDQGGSGEETPTQQDFNRQGAPEPQKHLPAKDRNSKKLVKDQGLPDPLDDSNGNAKVDTRVFISALRDRLTGAAPQPDAPNQPIQGWFESWRNPKVHIRPLLKP
ncbi:hypothetical protein L873DRAFT_1840136 [Choiromyces venosus 120613-1]|uniref:Uncharacterized protein n=1 Tax=Choiromyces venosus 120613-1 TaxID=1336337 RepID=A0A3N4K746_9PEZI|nr:hypothetical protein L873DRAFT_1840136 [Choiromyces venosus 120613-1]